MNKSGASRRVNYMARIVPTILLHFLHPWRSDVGSAENAWSNFQPTHKARFFSASLSRPEGQILFYCGTRFLGNCSVHYPNKLHPCSDSVARDDG